MVVVFVVDLLCDEVYEFVGFDFFVCVWCDVCDQVDFVVFDGCQYDCCVFQFVFQFVDCFVQCFCVGVVECCGQYVYVVDFDGLLCEFVVLV